MKHYLLLCMSLVVMAFASSNASAQCIYTSISDGNFFLPGTTTINPAVIQRSATGCGPQDNPSNSTIIIDDKVVLNGNFTTTGEIRIKAGGSLVEDGTRRTLTINTQGNVAGFLAIEASAERIIGSPQVNVSVLIGNKAQIVVDNNSVLRVNCTLQLINQSYVGLGNNALLNVLGDIDVQNGNVLITGPDPTLGGSPAGLRVAGAIRTNNGGADLFAPNDLLITCIQQKEISCTVSTGPNVTPANSSNDPSCISVLPVTLTRFVGNWTAGGTAVNLKWTTVTEVNNAHFAVERSVDGITFEKVAQVTGAGNSTILRNYTYTDTSPLAASSYYRLKQVDHDGKSTYSTIISLGKPQRATDWLVTTSSPRRFIIQSQLDANSRFSVLDVTGKPMFSQAVSSDNADVVIPSLPTGVYLFRLTTQQGRFTIRQVVTAGN
ncbi:T9SS type A sorting domain-containing protein [Hymenobacter sp. HDW8]|uniref:T9SS type A sorting domain-containing protein n=1 Tax=Hymenobacter sp. HDW8 TaxID=2714932 RepID=UPI00140B9DA7|nr:T9SS type A sorting domain-containing protein [Hymenobacter sp. HDW8]QIL76037.1 T9SS type A sorting domain-containing protein [Hymenobacter sp. HDW8]